MLNNPRGLSLIHKLGEEKELSENAIQDCIEFVKLVGSEASRMKR